MDLARLHAAYEDGSIRRDDYLQTLSLCSQFARRGGNDLLVAAAHRAIDAALDDRDDDAFAEALVG